MTFPVVYISHGAGPLPLLNEPNHQELVNFLSQLGPLLGRPAAILVISAHWEENIATVSSAAWPGMLYDYSGFPGAAYQIKYPAPGQPQLAARIIDLLQERGFPAQADNNRGFDHGTFVPLKLMYPAADIPVVQLSLLNTMDARTHIEIGKAIGECCRQDVLIIGSGFSFHNMGFSPATDTSAIAKSQAFDQWLNKVIVSTDNQEQALIDWEKAPHARYSHPREEHLLPLHVCFGAATANAMRAENIFDLSLFGAKISSFLWRN